MKIALRVLELRAAQGFVNRYMDRRTDGQTDTRAIAISPEPLGRGIKRTYRTKGFSYLLCVIGKLNVKLYELINNYYNYIRLILCLIMFLITKQLIIQYTN